MKTVSGKKVNMGPQYDAAIVDSPDSKTHYVSRFKGQTFKPKVTSPGVITIQMPAVVPSRPQGKQSMGAGKVTPMKRKAKNRRAVAAANPHDPGPNPMPSTKVHYVGSDKDLKKGYVKDKGWPLGKAEGPF